MLWLLLSCASSPSESSWPSVVDWTVASSSTSGSTTSETTPETTPETTSETTSETTPTGSGPLWRIHHGPKQHCVAPEEREAARFDTFTFPAATSMSEDMVGSGLVVADLFGDRNPAILTTGEERISLMRAAGNGWVDVTDQAIEDPLVNLAVGGSAADVDGDADLDVFIITENVNRLLINDGGVLRDRAGAWGLAETEWRSMSSSWADIDRDDDLDLVVGNYGQGSGNLHPSELYLNEGDHFVDVSHWLPDEVHDAWVFMTGWYDVDGDAYPDLFSIHDFANIAPHSVLLINDAGEGLTIDTASEFHADARGGMGAAFGDTNGDGTVDIAQTLLDDVSFLTSAPSSMSLGGWAWAFEQSEALGIIINRETGQQFGWGVEFGDLDNDTDLDLHAIFGDWADMGSPEMLAGPSTDALWVQQEDGHFIDEAAEWGVADVDNGRGMVMADIDRNGWLDIVKRELQNSNGLVHRARCGDAHWVGIRLSQPGTMNHFAIGATVDVWLGDQRLRRWIQSGSSSQFSSAPPEAHFGLGEHTAPDRVEVTWPDGTHTEHPFMSGDRWHHIERL